MKWVEKTGKTVEEAVNLALSELKVPRDRVRVVVLEENSKGLLKFFGGKQAKVRVEVLDDEINLLRNFLNDVIRAMDVKIDFDISNKEGFVNVNFNGPNVGLLIGRRGETLNALQFLANLVVNKNRSDSKNTVKVILDAEQYRRKREETLRRLANSMAQKVLRTGKNVKLEPMTSYERMIIHTTLQNHPQVYTYSEGEEPNRRVIIALK